MKAHPPLSKVEMIERSIRCFELGLFGLIPVIGIPMAVMALAESRRVKLGQGAMWNPAQRLLFWGTLCARAGLWPILILAVLVGISALFF
jgi:hypothetical protein